MNVARDEGRQQIAMALATGKFNEPQLYHLQQRRLLQGFN